jgi:hypothetical protein
MLKLKNISPNAQTIHNKSDFYLKIKILFDQREAFGLICYWSTSGPRGSLIEIGFEYPSGIIFEITVVAAPIIHYQCANIIHHNIVKKVGLPLFETSPWDPKINPLGYHVEFYEQDCYLRDENDFEIYISKKNITILFSSNTVVLHVINDPIIFGFDQDNNLCYIHMQNMVLNEEGFLEKII